jgi:hypothetical protein
MAGLSRDILKWLEGLDLKCTLKNVKRDFSNGYLAAQIFNLYFPADVALSGFDDAHSIAKKTDNWAQLQKFAAKRGFPLDDALVTSVVHQKDGAAIKLVEQIYTILTGKQPPPPPPATASPSRSAAGGGGGSEVNLPPFARATASKRIKDTLKRDVEVVKTDDQSVKLMAAKRALADHHRVTQLERTAEPARFAPIPRPNPLALGGSQQPFGSGPASGTSNVVYKGVSRKVGAGTGGGAADAKSAAVLSATTANGTAPLKFTTVSVKQIDSNFAAMQRTKALSPEKCVPPRLLPPLRVCHFLTPLSVSV